MTGRILLLDAGSTNLKWCWWQDGQLVPGGGAAHQGAPHSVVGLIPRHGVSRVLVASVLGESSGAALAEALAARLGIAPEFACSGAECCGVVNGYADPTQLGVDRWLALIAAHRRGPGGRVVVDCGTAVTIDVVDARGRHVGGQILPGPDAMYLGLTQATRLSPGLAKPAGLLGHDTVQCVASGVYHALAAAVERAAEVLPVDTSEGARVIMTGGDAALVAPLIREPLESCPHLVLEGLVSWAGVDEIK